MKNNNHTLIFLGIHSFDFIYLRNYVKKCYDNN